LEEIFMSVEEVKNARYEDHLAPFVNQQQLNSYLVTYGLVEPADTIRTSTTMMRETIIGSTPMGKQEVERQLLDSTECLVQLAFDETFIRFRDYVERMILTSFRRLNKSFNRYASITLIPLVGREGRILTLELTLGEDIRHIYFRKQFPGGRYRSDDEPEVCDLPGLREVAARGHLDDGV
jgi:hypothetical protein